MRPEERRIRHLDLGHWPPREESDRFTLLALYLFGGVTIRNFVLTLLIGIVSGTYSSIFNASQLLVVWEKGEVGRFLRRLPVLQAARR